MLGAAYVLAFCIFGDILCRPFIRFTHWPERLASAFLVGLLLSTWITYLGAAAVEWPIDPLIVGNLVFALAVAAVAVAFALILKRRPYWLYVSPITNLRTPLTDWVLLAVFVAASAWLMFTSFGFEADEVAISYLVRSDFGANLAISQSFSVGGNFPTEYPLFSGEPIRNHFLFWFQSGNLYFLGLHPVWSINLLSILSLASLLMLIIGLGERLFGSRVVGRIGAGLFFVHGSLSYFYAIWEYRDLYTAISAFVSSKKYLSSGFAYHGEDWGLWSLNVYINQRHLIPAIGIMALALFFWSGRKLAASGDGSEMPSSGRWDGFSFDRGMAGYAFCGLLIGLLPLWNGPVFLAAMLVFSILLMLLPDRRNLLILLTVSTITALPQLLFLRPEVSAGQQSYPVFTWGFNVIPPTVANVFSYLVHTFGFKLSLIVGALFVARRAERSFFVAISGLVLLAFTFKFSFEVLTNHKFLNIWLVFANLFAAYFIYWLWRWSVAGKLVAVVLLLLIIPGGVIDVFPVRNEAKLMTKFDKEPLVEWLVQNTEKDAIFLTDHYVDHPLLFAGRRIFQGYTYFTSAAGYDADKRQTTYREMLTSRNPVQVLELLTENGIDYVVFTNSLRRDQLKGQGNEGLYAQYFRQVFPNDQKLYEDLKIYKVAEPLVPTDQFPVGSIGRADEILQTQPLSNPRGLAGLPNGEYMIADTGNGVIRKFSADGKAIGNIGRKGSETGELKEPNGLALDKDGNLFVADSGLSKLMKFDAAGNFVGEWRPPDGGFYGPRDLAFGPNGQLYIVDQGRTRIVRFDPKSEVFTLSWGTSGNGNSQFNEPTGIAIGHQSVFVMDTGNDRIQVFDLDGVFIGSWEVPAWRGFSNRYPDAAFDETRKMLYITSSGTNEILMFDEKGTQLGSIVPNDDSHLSNPCTIILREMVGAKELLILNNKSATVSRIGLQESGS